VKASRERKERGKNGSSYLLSIADRRRHRSTSNFFPPFHTQKNIQLSPMPSRRTFPPRAPLQKTSARCRRSTLVSG